MKFPHVRNRTPSAEEERCCAQALVVVSKRRFQILISDFKILEKVVVKGENAKAFPSFVSVMAALRMRNVHHKSQSNSVSFLVAFPLTEINFIFHFLFLKCILISFKTKGPII